ncbi:hypothetical protein SAMN06264867_103203 [Halorubrum cibi]|uniref:Uncharacterized protein n=2 Tax=Halorubrum cibi TaxID=413815 RepID=A0A521BZL9_9EURY|nr:hypothetical protein [Halorubrum cibi]SMO52545.1 hypothetical protein SAMN06264867_103203 [Halorubrum cibi]
MTGRSSRPARWFLLDANRLLVAGVSTLAVFVAFVAVASAVSPSFVTQLESGDPIETMFGAMITVVVTGTTLVVTIGQLVLTQENGPLGDQRDRMSNSMDVREFTADLTGSPAATDPAAFLDDLVRTAADRAEALRESVSGSADASLESDVEELTGDVRRNAEPVSERLDGARFGSFSVVSAALGFEYGRLIGRVERVSSVHAASLSDRDRELLGELKGSLSLFGPAREHVKTLYFQWALIELSQLILYAAVPALVVAGVTLAVVDAAAVPGATLGVANVVLVVGGAFAVTVLPFMLFVSYVLRILTVAKRTLAIEPLVLRGE